MTDQKGIPVGGNHKTRTAEWIGSIHTRVGRRFRRPSPRTVLALATVPAVVVGLAQFSDTSAAFTDSAMANSSMSSAAKLLPAPDTLGCDEVGISGAHVGVRLKWKHMASPFKYSVIIRRDDNVSAYSTEVLPGATAVGGQLSIVIGDAQVGSHTGWEYNAEIRSINTASNQTSTDWRGYRLKQPTIWNIDCSGDRSSISATSGTEQALRNPAAPSETPVTTEPTTNAKSPTTSEPSSTAGTTTSATRSTTPGPTTSGVTSEATPTTTDEEAAATTTPSETSTGSKTTTTTAPSKPVTSPSGKNSAAVLADTAGAYLVVQNGAGETIYRTSVPADSTVAWTPDGDIRITNATGTETVSSDNWTK